MNKKKFFYIAGLAITFFVFSSGSAFAEDPVIIGCVASAMNLPICRELAGLTAFPGRPGAIQMISSMGNTSNNNTGGSSGSNSGSGQSTTQSIMAARMMGSLYVIGPDGVATPYTPPLTRRRTCTYRANPRFDRNRLFSRNNPMRTCQY